MAINSITQTISTLPPAGKRGIDVQTQFITKQEDFQDHLQGTTVTELNTLKDQLNSRIGEINSTTTTMNGYANTASAGASTATTKAGEASTSASAALTSKNQAGTFATNSSNSATKASQWADNNYNVAVETGKYSAKHWSTVAQNATTGKVDKVPSTDNAIVRFDGVIGAVQNSSVIIDDSGQIVSNLKVAGGVGYNVDTSTFIANTLASGAVIERGSNANGTYVKFADGTLICTYLATVTDQGIATSYSGGLFTGIKVHTFPHIFNSIPSVAPFGRWGNSASWSTVRGVTVTMVDVYYIDVAIRAAGPAFLVGYTAIGSWK